MGTITTEVEVLVRVVSAGTTDVAGIVVVVVKVEVSAVLVSSADTPTVVLEKVVLSLLVTTVVPSETEDCARAPAARARGKITLVNFIFSV